MKLSVDFPERFNSAIPLERTIENGHHVISQCVQDEQ